MSIYLEIDSTYRDRNKNPNPAEFELSFDKPGTNLFNSFDPVSYAVPVSFFEKTNLIIGGISPFSDSPSQTLTSVIIVFNKNVANKTLNWYRNSQVQFNYGNFQTSPYTYRLIKKWEYMSSNATKDLFRVTLDIPLLMELNGNKIGYMTFISVPNFQSTGTGVVPGGYEVSSLYKNYYVYNETLNISTRVLSYNGRFSSLTIRPNGSYAIVNNIILRKELPVAYGATVAGSTNNTIVLNPTTASGAVDAYKGMFIRFTSGSNRNSIIGIYSYTGAKPVYKPAPNESEILIPAYTITLLTSLSTTVSTGTTYEILPFTKDNYRPLKYTGSIINQESCYNVRLINLTIPNITLESGGTIASYPYLYVKFHNNTITSGENKVNMIYSNNPNSNGKLFRIPVSDFSTVIDDAFLTMDRCNQIQTIRFNPSRGFHFGVYLPNGDVLTSLIKDKLSPYPPDQFLQFSANFMLDPVIN